MKEEQQKSSELIFSAAVELANHGQTVTRDSLQQATGLKLSIVDDRVKVLIDDGLLVRIERGVYKPLCQHAPCRVISKTVLTDGSVVIDIGDDVLSLTPREAMVLGKLLAGDAMAFAGVEVGNQLALLNGSLQREVAQLRRRLSRDIGEQDLFQGV